MNALAVEACFCVHRPTILRFVKMSVSEASSTLCGELAENSELTTILLETGARRFSMALGLISEIKIRIIGTVRQISLQTQADASVRRVQIH